MAKLDLDDEINENYEINENEFADPRYTCRKKGTQFICPTKFFVIT